MQKKDFVKTREELEEEKKKNNGPIYMNDERTRMAKVNQFEYKAMITLVFSMVAYLILFISSGFLISTTIFSGLQYPIALVIGSFGIGTIMRKVLEKKAKLKERLRAFSVSKTQADLLEEEIKYQIELEKINTRNRILTRVEETLHYQEENLDRMSRQYDIYDKITLNSEDEMNQKIKNSESLIKEQYEELDIAIIQKVLHDRFWKIRAKGQKELNMMIAFVAGFIGTLIFTMFPTLMVGVSSSLIVQLIPPLLAGMCGTGYMVKRNQDYKKVFHRFNSKLGNHRLSETLSNSLFNSAVDVCIEWQNLQELIENKMGNISVAIMELKEQQRALETIQSESSKLPEELKRAPYTREEIRTCEQESMLLSETDIVADTSKKKGPVLIKKMHPDFREFKK